MIKRLTAVFVLAAMLLALLTACGGQNGTTISAEKAQKIAMEDAGFSKKEISDIHTHVSTYDNAPCYSVHITTQNGEYEYFLDPRSGEILDRSIID